MRLSAEEREAIAATAAEILPPGTSVRLFGSRLDDNARGGDIDLLLEPPTALEPNDLVDRRNRFIARLYHRLGEQRIDVVIAARGDSDPRAVVQAARRAGRELIQLPQHRSNHEP